MRNGWTKTQKEYSTDNDSKELEQIIKYIEAVEKAKHADKEECLMVAALVKEHKLVWEHVPTWLLKSKEVSFVGMVNMIPRKNCLYCTSKITEHDIYEVIM